MFEEVKHDLRLQKFLAHAGVASRRQSEQLILSGKVKVNDEFVTTLGTKINPAKDKVFVEGNEITRKETSIYYILNKPRGYITSRSDEKNRPTVLELINSETRIYPVGRLDFNSRGLLLLTNDGDLAYRLTHPSFEIPKIYKAWVNGRLEKSDIRKLSYGVMLNDGLAKAFDVEKLAQKGNKTVVKLVLREGRKRQVRRMFEEVGFSVVDLLRTGFANLSVEGLPEGKYRELTKNELFELKKMTKLHQEINLEG